VEADRKPDDISAQGFRNSKVLFVKHRELDGTDRLCLKPLAEIEAARERSRPEDLTGHA
jgi:hypothetical protein